MFLRYNLNKMNKINKRLIKQVKALKVSSNNQIKQLIINNNNKFLKREASNNNLRNQKLHQIYLKIQTSNFLIKRMFKFHYKNKDKNLRVN